MTKNNYRRGRHSITLLYAHLVFVTKYRKKVFKAEHLNAMPQIFSDVALKMNFQVLEINGESDHVHVLIEYPPKLSLSQIVNALKGVSSRMLRKQFDLTPHQDHLWSPSYFAISCGGATDAEGKSEETDYLASSPIEKIKNYIQNQKSP
jgi:putative transposase